MIELRLWRQAHPFGAKPWLVLGKGPTFARRHEFDLSEFHLLALNHVVTEMPVDIAHMIDFEVAEACAGRLDDNCRFLLMPRHPHLDFAPSLLTLEELVQHVPALRALDEAGRVVCYDLHYDLAVQRRPADPDAVHVRYFSSEAAVDALGLLGASDVRTLGVDGGSTYSPTFSGMATLLSNGQPSFSRQFEGIREAAERHALTVRPLVEPLRIFIGADESQALAAQVLEHSIREHTSAPVEIRVLSDVRTRTPLDPRNHARTEFSFSRFHIPALCGYRGRALYLDADMQVFSDVAALWRIPFDGAAVMCTSQPEPPEAWRDNPAFHAGRQLSVMMLDCALLDWQVDRIVDELDAGDYTYDELMFDLCVVPPDRISDAIPPEWNHLERYEPGVTRLTHYTVVPTQPWKNDLNPLRHVWEAQFERAWRDGAVDAALLRALVRAGHVKSALTRLAPDLPPPVPSAPAGAVHAELRAVRAHLLAVERRTVGSLALRASDRLRRSVRALGRRG